MTEALVDVEHLTKCFPVRSGLLDRLRHRETYVTAVDDVSFQIERGSVLGLVGESGCGKTTLGRLVLGLARPTSGLIRFAGQDISTLKGNEMLAMRRRMQLVQQDPTASLNPRMKIGDAIGHGLVIHSMGDRSTIRETVLRTMESVGLTPAESLYERYPRDLSGGMKQRVCIARAIILKPEFIVADEPVAMLDVSIRAMILGLLQKARSELGLTLLFITHDLTTAYYLCDRVMVMYMGQLVEMGPAKSFFRSPLHPYSLALLSSAREGDPDLRVRKQQQPPRQVEGKIAVASSAKGEVPNPLNPPSGCRFHPRCTYASEVCTTQPPKLEHVIGHNREEKDEGGGEDTATMTMVACHNYTKVRMLGEVEGSKSQSNDK